MTDRALVNRARGLELVQSQELSHYFFYYCTLDCYVGMSIYDISTSNCWYKMKNIINIIIIIICLASLRILYPLRISTKKLKPGFLNSLSVTNHPLKFWYSNATPSLWVIVKEFHRYLLLTHSFNTSHPSKSHDLDFLHSMMSFMKL